MRDRSIRCLVRLSRALCAASMLAAAACISDPFDPALAYGITSIRVTPESVTVSGEPSIFAKDGTADLSITLFDDSSRSIWPDVQPVWSSSDPSVARVTASGTVTGLRPGRARIIATVGSVHGYSTVTVFPAVDTGIVIAAHRGFRSTFPENTLVAINGALELGAEAVEVDVRLTSDGVPILMHDRTVDRTTNGIGVVQFLTFVQIRKFDACSKFGSAWTPCSVPTLAEALETARGRGLLIIHLKDSYTNAGLSSVVSVVKGDGMLQQVVLASENYQMLVVLRQIDGAVPLGLFTDAQIPNIAEIEVLGRTVVMPDYQTLLAHPAESVALFKSAAAEHATIMVWTITDVEDAKAIVALGGRRIMSDVPLDRTSLR